MYVASGPPTIPCTPRGLCCAFQVPTEFGPGQAREIVAKALGRPLSEVFASFDDTPMGVASIGEAHRATLLDGREVVVKVMMNGIEEKFRADLATIIAFCKLAQPQHVLVRAGVCCLVGLFVFGAFARCCTLSSSFSAAVLVCLVWLRRQPRCSRLDGGWRLFFGLAWFVSTGRSVFSHSKRFRSSS